jgi:hypothetical protein
VDLSLPVMHSEPIHQCHAYLLESEYEERSTPSSPCLTLPSLPKELNDGDLEWKMMAHFSPFGRCWGKVFC